MPAESGFDQGKAESMYAEFLPKIKEFAEKKPEEISQDELNELIHESQGIEMIPQNHMTFRTLVDLRRALFRPEDRPKESAEELMAKLRETV